MNHCKIDSGDCDSRSARIIWTPTAHLTSSHYDTICDGNVLIHYDDKFQVLHLEILQVDMAIHHLLSCEPQLKKCFTPPIFCDSGKLLIQTTNCSELRQFVSLPYRAKQCSRSTTHTQEVIQSPFSRMLNKLSDKINL